MHAVIRVPALLPRLHVLAVLVPEIRGQLLHAGVEEIGVLEHLVVEIILGRQAQRARLDAHVDVFGHQHDRAVRVGFVQKFNDADDLVVGLAAGEPHGQNAADGLGLEEQPPGRVLGAMRLQRDSLVDVGLLRC